MSTVKKYIKKFNNLHGKSADKKSIESFLNKVRSINNPGLNQVESKLTALVNMLDKKKNAVKIAIDSPLKYKPVVKVKPKKLKFSVVPTVEKVKPKPTKKVKVKKLPVVKSKPIPSIDGFTTADRMPTQPANVFNLAGEIGKFLGTQQRYRLQIIIDGEKHSSKSELVKQIGNAFIDLGYKTALIDYEQGGMFSKDTQSGINRNVTPDNRKKLFVSNAEFPTTVEALKKIATQFDVILIDSGSKLKIFSNEWLDELRTEFPKTIWVVLMHQNAKGNTKGGSAAGYNAPVVIKTFRPDKTDPLKNYAMLEKNRGNICDKWYMIALKKVVNNDPSKSSPSTTNENITV